jgi:hypothetical protein
MSHGTARHPLARRLVRGALAIGLLAGLCGCVVEPIGYHHSYHHYHYWR